MTNPPKKNFRSTYGKVAPSKYRGGHYFNGHAHLTNLGSGPVVLQRAPPLSETPHALGGANGAFLSLSIFIICF